MLDDRSEPTPHYIQVDASAVLLIVWPGIRPERSVLLLAGAGQVPAFNHNSSWARLAEFISELGYMSVCADYVGAGESEGEFEYPTLRRPASREVHAVLTEIRRERPGTRCTIVGHCFGGVSATAAVATAGSNVDQIILVAPPFRDEQEADTSFFPMENSDPCARTLDDLAKCVRDGVRCTIVYGELDEMYPYYASVVRPTLRIRGVTLREVILPGRVYALQDRRAVVNIENLLAELLAESTSDGPTA